MSKSCWITGASSGIGRATAVSFAKRGDTVFASARSLEGLISLQKECEALSLKGKIVPLKLDVTNVNEISKSLKYITNNIKNCVCVCV